MKKIGLLFSVCLLTLLFCGALAEEEITLYVGSPVPFRYEALTFPEDFQVDADWMPGIAGVRQEEGTIWVDTRELPQALPPDLITLAVPGTDAGGQRVTQQVLVSMVDVQRMLEDSQAILEAPEQTMAGHSIHLAIALSNDEWGDYWDKVIKAGRERELLGCFKAELTIGVISLMLENPSYIPALGRLRWNYSQRASERADAYCVQGSVAWMGHEPGTPEQQITRETELITLTVLPTATPTASPTLTPTPTAAPTEAAVAVMATSSELNALESDEEGMASPTNLTRAAEAENAATPTDLERTEEGNGPSLLIVGLAVLLLVVLALLLTLFLTRPSFKGRELTVSMMERTWTLPLDAWGRQQISLWEVTLYLGLPLTGIANPIDLRDTHVKPQRGGKFCVQLSPEGKIDCHFRELNQKKSVAKLGEAVLLLVNRKNSEQDAYQLLISVKKR